MTPQLNQLIHYIKHEIIGITNLAIDLHTPLISSGLVDSFALVNIVAKVEQIYGISLPLGAIQAQDLETIGTLLQTVQRFQ